MTPDSSDRTRSRLSLAALTVVVLLAHGAILRATPLSLGFGSAATPPEPARTFLTRAVEPERPAPVKPKNVPQVRRAAPLPAPPTPNEVAPADVPPAESAIPPAPVTAVAQAPSTEPAEPLAQASEAEPTPVSPNNGLPVVSSEALPGSVRLKYTLKSSKLPFTANAELLWQQTGQTYDARVELSAFGLSRVQTSRGEIGLHGLEPTRFSDKYRSELAAHFNREQGKITFSANTPDAVLLPGAQDRVSIMVQLAALIASAPDLYPESTTIAIQTIGPRDAAPWLFTVIAWERLDLPGGEQTTLKLVRNPRREYDQKVELWLAPALGYLPARIRMTEHNGDSIDQQWLITEPLI